jgi:hypothetical protein
MSRPRRRSWLSEAIIILVLVLLPLLFWWRLWALDPADRAVIPQGDFTDQYAPLHLFAARELAAGRLPAWNPYINAGQPGLADIQTAFFYPLNLAPSLVLALLGLPFTLNQLTAQVILHFSLASLFNYLFVRHLARRAGARLAAARFAGAVAAMAFTYGGYLTSFPVQQLTILQTAVWLPLVLLFLDRAIGRSRALSQVILAGLAWACALLAGHPQTAMYVTYTALAYGLFLIWKRREEEDSIRYWAVGIGYFLLLPLFIGVALAAIQLGPTLGFIARSTRAGLDFEAVAWGFPLVEMTHLLYPGYFGGSPQYVGILTLVLAAAALLVKRARREVVFWLVVAALVLLLAFGQHTFFYTVTYLLAPGFAAVRNQERVIYLFAFAFSILAGYGALVLVQPLPPPVRKGFRCFVRGLGWVFAAFLALTALWFFGYLQGQQQGVEFNLFEGLLRHHVLLLVILAGSVLLFNLRLKGRARRSVIMALTLGLMGLNLFTVNWRYNLAEPQAQGTFPQTELVSFLKAQPGVHRISSSGRLPGGASAGIVYELEDITGNTPLRLDSFQRFEDQVGNWRRWQLLNVHFALSKRDLDGPGLERVFEEGAVKAYRVGDPLSRAWVVHETLVAGDEGAVEALNTGDFDPRVTAVLPPESSEIAFAVQPGEIEAAPQVVTALPGRLVLDLSAQADGLLVISQPFYPGWRARVDDEQVPIYRVNYLLQGLPVTAGDHRVELSYHLSPWPAIISLAALVGCAVALLLAHRRTRSEDRA